MTVGDLKPKLYFRAEGNLFLTDAAGLTEARAIFDMHQRLGSDALWLEPEDIKGRWPLLNVDGIAAGPFSFHAFESGGCQGCKHGAGTHPKPLYQASRYRFGCRRFLSWGLRLDFHGEQVVSAINADVSEPPADAGDKTFQQFSAYLNQTAIDVAHFIPLVKQGKFAVEKSR